MANSGKRIGEILTSDNIVIIGIIFIVPISYLLGPKIPSDIVRGAIVGLATLIALLSYRYSVQSNVRDTVSAIEPIEVGGYKAIPVVNDVRWRPNNPFGRKLHRGKEPPDSLISKIGLWLRPRTTIQLLIYDVSGKDKKIALDDEPMRVFDITIEEISNENSDIYTQRLPFTEEIYVARKVQSGIDIGLLTNDVKQIKKAIQAVFIAISSSSDSVTQSNEEKMHQQR